MSWRGFSLTRQLYLGVIREERGGSGFPISTVAFLRARSGHTVHISRPTQPSSTAAQIWRRSGSSAVLPWHPGGCDGTGVGTTAGRVPPCSAFPHRRRVFPEERMALRNAGRPFAYHTRPIHGARSEAARPPRGRSGRPRDSFTESHVRTHLCRLTPPFALRDRLHWRAKGGGGSLNLAPLVCTRM